MLTNTEGKFEQIMSNNTSARKMKRVADTYYVMRHIGER